MPEEIAFFSSLRAELLKVAQFFLEREAAMAALFDGLMLEVAALEVRCRRRSPALHPWEGVRREGDPTSRDGCGGEGALCGTSVAGVACSQRGDCSDLGVGPQASREPLAEAVVVVLAGKLVQFYTDLIMLENFAVMNYCGFGKILKKHDKLTGFATKRKFMRNLVDVQAFSQYPNVLRMLEATERSYQSLLDHLPASLCVPPVRASRTCPLRVLSHSRLSVASFPPPLGPQSSGCLFG